MKKSIKKYWGIGLIVMLITSLLIMAAPVSAADPLNWEMKVADTPSPMFQKLNPGSDVTDYAVDASGMTMYAAYQTWGGITGVVTVLFVDAGDTFDENYTFTYVNENGVAARTGTAVVPSAAIVGTAVAITLQAGDTGISDITNVPAVVGVPNDATAGSFTISNTVPTVLVTYTFTGAVTDGAVNPGVYGLSQSTMGGAMWTIITGRLPAGVLASIDYVAMAPDDPNVVVVASATPGAAITINGGATWTSMGVIQSGTLVACTGINGLAISPMVTGGFRYIVAYGTAGANLPGLYYYNYGAGVGAWKNAILTTGAGGTDFVTGPIIGGVVVAYDTVEAFEFSGSFPSDYMGAAVLADPGTAGLVGTLDYHILSFNSKRWDTAIAAGYPVSIYTGSAVGAASITVNQADLALLPDYDGGDETLRIGFVGATITDAGLGIEMGGVWRHYDSAPAAKIVGTAALGLGIYSVAFDGTNVVAGASLSNVVFRSADPLATSPTFLPARTLKRIGVDGGGNDNVNVKFVGENLFGSKIGTASAISKSTDYGNTWNDFSQLDSALMVIDDIYMTAAGDPWYLAAHDGATSSVYRMDFFSITRVLCVPFAAGVPDFMLRGIDSDANVIYAADEGGTVLYYSADGGLERWYMRASVPAAMADLAVESAQTIYIGSGINVFKSVNSGFVWGPPMNTRLGGANVVNTLLTVGENELIVGGTAGGVCWTTDGGTSWFAAMGVIFGGPMQLAATGLGPDDYIFVGDEANNSVWRCSTSPANFMGEFKTMNFPIAAAAETNTGLVLKDGVLYVLQNGAANVYLTETLMPAVPGTHVPPMWGTRYIEAGWNFNNSPSALKVSSGAPGSIMLFALQNVPFPMVFYFDQTMSLSGPALNAPPDGERIEIVSSLLGNVQAVNFTWTRLSLATNYELQVALDDGFASAVNLDGLGNVAVDADPACEILSGAPIVSQIIAGANFQPGRTYYWRVRAYAPTTSAYSETRTFIIQPTAATVPTVSSPEIGGTIDSTTPAFSWTPVSGATMYQFQLSDDPAFGTTMVDEQLAAAGIMPSVALDRGTTYFWRVKAIAPVDGDWSTVANFIVAELAPAPAPPVVVEQTPAPVINIPAAPPATVVEIPPAPADEVISPAYIWAIIIIGAVLVIAVIVLIVRTRRQV